MNESLARPSAAVLLLAASPTLAAAQLDYTDATGAVAGLAMEGGRTEIEHGDVNGDGHPDLILVGDHGSPNINSPQHGVTLWMGDGAGGWTLIQVGDFGYGGLALGDVNGDGLTDVGYGVHHDYSATDLGDQILEVALGDGTGASWTPYDDGLATNGEDWGMFGTDFADVDGDGDLDLGSVSFGCCAGIHVYLNDGDGSWTQSFGFYGGNSSQDFEFADVDGDGRHDLVTAHQNDVVYRGDGAGGFVLAHGNLPSSYSGTGSGDVDGDGADEVSLVVSGAPRVFRWGAGDQWTDLSGDLPGTGSFEATELCDMDLDGRADLVAAGDGELRIWSWSVGDVWTPLHSSTIPGPGDKNVKALRAGVDLDHNGYPDLSLVQEESTGPFSDQNRHKVLFESSTPGLASVHLLAPSAARTWRVGEVRFVDWTSALVGGAPGTATVELSTSGPAGPWTTLASGLPNSGRHQLVVPTVAGSAACHVRVSVLSAAEQATAVSAAFRIEGAVGASFCTSSPNSTGGAAVIAASGWPQLGAPRLTLSAAPVPVGQSGLFFYGATTAQLPYGNGTLCVASPQTRLPVEVADAGGALAHEIDFGSPPASTIQPGDTLHLQAWFRDPAGGGAGFDFSDGLTVTFAP